MTPTFTAEELDRGDLALTGLKIALSQLESYKRNNTSSKPVELDWEIRVYKWIIAQPDAEKKSGQYLRARYDGYKTNKSKQQIVKELGWVVE